MADTYQSKYTGAEIDERLEWAEEISPHIAKQLNTEDVDELKSDVKEIKR